MHAFRDSSKVPEESPFEMVELQAGPARLAARHLPRRGAEVGLVCLAGIGGGFESPGPGIYPYLLERLGEQGAAGLWVEYRRPGDLRGCVEDALAGVAFLESEDVQRIGILGWSFGGAVALQAAAQAPSVRAVVTFATQGHGAGPALTLGPRCALMLVHGKADPVLPFAVSEGLHLEAREPKRLLLVEGAGHVLMEDEPRVQREVEDFLVTILAP